MTVPSKTHEQGEDRNEEEGEQRGPPDAPEETLHSRAANRRQLDIGTLVRGQSHLFFAIQVKMLKSPNSLLNTIYKQI